jgi:L-fuconolactonase
MIVDAHHHFWVPERGDYHWMPTGESILNRRYMPEDLRHVLRKCGVDRTVLIQAAQTEAETEFLLEVAAETDFVAGVVGWMDLEDAEFEPKLNKLMARRKFVGIRPMLHDIEDDAFLVRPKVIKNLRLVAERDLAFDVLARPQHLPYVCDALEQVSELKVVIDHLAKPRIADGTLEGWAEYLKVIGSHPNAFCKLSGMVTEANRESWRPRDLLPFIDVILGIFTNDRLMFGSDWPVCLLAAEYGEVLNALRLSIDAQVGPDGVGKIYGTNALKFYKIGGSNE